jgi:hypothetical protein
MNSASLDELQSEARRTWRAWAVAIAQGGPQPQPRELLDAGTLLGLASPADQLERLADAIKEHPALLGDQP